MQYTHFQPARLTGRLEDWFSYFLKSRVYSGVALQIKASQLFGM